MFKKPKRNFRSRKHDSDEEEEKIDREEDVQLEILTPAEIAVKKLGKKKKDKSESAPTMKKSSSATSVLSFDEEVDSEVFQIKRSSHSRRVARQLKKEHQKEKEEEEKNKTSESQAPGRNYSTSALKELQAEQQVKNGVAPVDMELGSDVELSPRRQDPEDGDREGSSNGRDLVEEDEDSLASSQASDIISKDSVKDILASGVIPDAAMIHQARKRRQLARERGDEYIPIENNSNAGKPGSRLIREEDHDRSDDDEDERTSFTVTQREQELRKMQDLILEAEQGSHSEGSDQEREWEEQQIRKGVKAGIPASEDSNHYASFYGQSASTFTATHGALGSDSPNAGPILASKSAPPSNLPTISVEQVTKKKKVPTATLR